MTQLQTTRSPDQATGRVPGFWLALSGVLLAAAFPLPAFIVAVVGFGFSVRAFKAIPVKHTARRLPLAGSVLGALAISLVVGSDLAAFLSR